MRIIFFGTSEFAVPILQALSDHYRDALVAVVTTPDQPVGRHAVLTPSPVKQFLETHPPTPPLANGGTKGGIEILQPEKLKEIIPHLQELKPDLIVVTSYGKIIPQAILDIPRLGCLNVHPSLLPRHRGASPIQTTILQGDTETGVTIMQMDAGVDHGPLVASDKWPVAHGITYKELEKELSELGVKLLIDTLPRYIAGEITPQEQDHTKATFTKIFTREDGHIEWSESAEQIERMVRALNPWPGTFCKFKSTPSPQTLSLEGRGQGEGTFHILKILKAKILHKDIGCVQDPRPGVLWRTEDKKLAVNANPGSLVLEEVQPEGKKPMNSKNFINGHKDILRIILE